MIVPTAKTEELAPSNLGTMLITSALFKRKNSALPQMLLPSLNTRAQESILVRKRTTLEKKNQIVIFYNDCKHSEHVYFSAIYFSVVGVMQNDATLHRGIFVASGSVHVFRTNAVTPKFGIAFRDIHPGAPER